MFVKTVLFALLASPAAIAAATGLSDGQLSAREEIARSIEDDGDTGFDWSSRIVKSDKEETKLHGDAKSIYEQILALNPQYDADEVNPSSTIIDARDLLDKRADALTCTDARNYLQKLGGTCGAPKADCLRTICENSTVTYLCGEPRATSVSCCEVGEMVDQINKNYCKASQGRSGHIYRNREFSVWMG